MIRTVIAVDDDIKMWIDAKASRDGISMTELVRRALRHYRDQEDQSINKLLTETSGIWTSGDGLEYQRALRDGWGE